MSRQPKQPYERFEINSGPVVRLANVGALTVMVCLGLIIAWTVVTPVDEVAKARGAVEPISEVQRLQSEFGGAIASVRVRKGDLVTEGDLIAVFDPSEFSSQLRETRAKELSLNLERERLLALVEDRDPSFEPIGRRAIQPELTIAIEEGRGPALDIAEHIIEQMIEREKAAYASRRAFLENEKQVIQRQITGKQADIGAIAAERPALARQLAVAKEQVSAVQGLVDRGLAPRPRLVEATNEEANYDYQLASLSGREAVLNAELAELGERLEEIDLNQAAEARERITDINEELQETQEQIVRILRRVVATELKAPVSGFVQTVPDTVVGRIIEPGGVVAEIVPKDVGLRFAAELGPRDVGFVTPGQTVNLKIDAFDFSRYGALPAVVAEVSPTTIVDERGSAFYEVLVDIPEPFFRGDPARFALLPGMTGEADILTGKKTVFEYIWKPIYTNLDLALTER